MEKHPRKIEHYGSDTDMVKLFKDNQAFPRMAVINTTFVCNAVCPHCPYTNSDIRSEKRAKDYPFISKEVFKKIADQVGAQKRILRVSGAGEPLMHKRIVEYIEYAKSAGCQVGLITNGSLMTESAALRLLSCGIDMIEFSVDAADEETYQVVRKGLNFAKTLGNITRTVELRNEMKAPANIIASVVNQKVIAEKVPFIVAFWEKVVDSVQVRKYLTWDINDLSDSGDITPYLNPDAPCPFPFDRMLIDTNGDVRFCVYDIIGRTRWGNVMETPISEIWQNEHFAELRDIHQKKEFHRMALCHNCLDRQFRSWKYNYFHLKDKASQEKQKKHKLN
jgi:radical SAM protein with 4Fe4S-binding SPASM domain